MNGQLSHLGNATGVLSEKLVDQAVSVVREAEDSVSLDMVLVVDGHQHVAVPRDLAEFVFEIITATSNRGLVSVRTMPSELTTSVAASELGISRPTLMKLVERGELPSHKVGTHTRIMRADIAEYRERRARDRASALEYILEVDTSSDHDPINGARSR